MPSKDCLVHIVSRFLMYFVLIGLISVEISQAFVSNNFSRSDNQLITKLYLDTLHSKYSSTLSGEHFKLVDSPTITIVCKDNANISLELGVAADNEIRSQPLIIIPSEQVELPLFPNVRSYFVLVGANSTSPEPDVTDPTHFYTASLVHIRELVNETESVLEWEALEICVHINEPSFAAALVIQQDFDGYEEIFPLLFVPKDTEDGNSVLSGVLSPNKTGTVTNISRTDEADDTLNDQPDKRSSSKNEYSKQKHRKLRFRNLILPESQRIYTTFRYTRHSAGELGELHPPTDQQTDSPYISELKAVAIHYMTGFGSNCPSEPNSLVGVSLSSEDKDEKSYQEIVDFYLTLLNLKCYPSLLNNTIRLFKSGILIPTRGWNVVLNQTKAYTVQRILSPNEFEEIISAFYFTSFSKSYLTLISNKSPVTSTPSGKLISSSSRLISLFTLNLLELFPHYSTHKSFIDFHLVKILSRLTQTLEYFYLTLLNEGNQLVCQVHEENPPSPCQALRKIKFNNLMQIAGLIHFLTHKIPDLMSFQNDLDYNSSYTEDFRHHRDELLDFVRNSTKNKSIT